MTPVRQILIAVHVVIGLALIAVLCRQLGERAKEVNQVRIQAQQERDATQRTKSDIVQMDELRKGLDKSDPYVVELLVREKLQYSGLGRDEYHPTPAPAVDHTPNR
ncbi:MAG: hypothetical protein H0W83_16890 [Planctomycetes bacterium]|nr:hypothetical protein [Planctomycetota bacterium]